MIFSLERTPAPPPPRLVLILLVGIYLLAGVIGHDPWKGEDAIHIGIAHGFWQEGSWLLPRIAGEAWPHTAPFYHWMAALLGGTLEPVAGFHQGARLASSLFGLIFFIALGGAARTLCGQSAGRIAPLLAIGTLGLLVPFHETQPAIAGLACAAIAWWGGGLLWQGQAKGAWVFGAGAGLACATHGLVGGLMVLAVLLAPTFRGNLRSLLIAILIALPLALAWPIITAQVQPEYIATWWRNEWAEATLRRHLPEREHLELLAWATWPVLPLSCWGAWTLRRNRSLLALLLIGITIGLLWFLTGPARGLGLFPAMIPWIILAAAGAERLRRGATNAFDWFAAITFSLIAVVIWLGASAMTFGWPAGIARNFAKLAPGYSSSMSVMAIMLALLATLGWITAWRLPRAPWRSSLRWAAGGTMMWVLVTSLWLGWIDHYKSYRSVVFDLRQALPGDADCLERSGMSISQRALLDYFTGLRPIAPTRNRTCTWRLTVGDPDRDTPAGWETLWQGYRPSDRKKERWYLDRRRNANNAI